MQKLDSLRDALSRRPFDEIMAENFEKLKSQSERLHYSEAKGAQARARVKWIEKILLTFTHLRRIQPVKELLPL